MINKLTAAQRQWLYRIAVAAVILLVAYNVIGPEHAPLWLDLAANVLGLGLPVAASGTAATKLRGQIKDGTLVADETP